jgi:hypothetical protein
LQTEQAAALPEGSREPALVISSNPSTPSGGELDSWEVLKQSHAFMKENGLSRPLLVAQAFHVGRFTLQARKQGMTGLIVPAGLPREFDPNSLQRWTRNEKEWAKRELPGILYLELVSHKL